MRALLQDVPLTSKGFALSTSADRLGHLVPADPARPRTERNPS